MRTVNAYGRLAEIRDRHAVEKGKGNRIKIYYDTLDRPISLRDDLGRYVRFGYYSEDAQPGAGGAYPGLLNTVTDFTNRTWTYTYDACANLAGVKGPDDVVVASYAYRGGCSDDPTLKVPTLNLASNMLSTSDALNEIQSTIYDETKDGISGQTVGGTSITYAGIGRTSTVTVGVQRDPTRAPLQTTYTLTGKGHVAALLDPEQKLTQFLYDDAGAQGDGLLTSIEKPEHNKVTFTYQGGTGLTRGNLLTTAEIPRDRSHGETDITTTYGYDSHSFPTSGTTS